MVDLSEVEVMVPAFRRCWKRKEAPAKPVPAARGRNAPRRAENMNGLDMVVNVEQQAGIAGELTFTVAQSPRCKVRSPSATPNILIPNRPREITIQSAVTTTTKLGPSRHSRPLDEEHRPHDLK